MNALTRLTPSLFLALLALLTGCAKPGQVYVTKNLTTKLDQFPTVHVAATGTTAETNRAARRLEKMLGDRLKQAGVFEGVDDRANLVMRCKVTHMEFGDELKRELSLKGKAKVTIEVRITEPDGTLLGHITAKAQTTRKNADDEPAVRVLELAADAVVDYMKQRRSKASGSAKAKSNVGSDDAAKVEADADEAAADEGDADSADGDDESKDDDESKSEDE